MRFRHLITSRLLLGIVDLLGHCCIAYIIGGHYWFQFLPDIFLPYLLAVSLITNKFIDEHNAVLFCHRFMHTIVPALTVFASACVLEKKMLFILSAQLVTHVFWDKLTHPEPEFKKDLLWPEVIQ